MIEFFVGIYFFLLFFILHIFLWRTNIVKKKPSNILFIYIISFVIAVVTFHFLIYPSLDLNFSEIFIVLHATLLSFSLFCAYLMTYPGIESDSPSCTILLNIEKNNKQGTKFSQIAEVITDDIMTLERINGLVRDQKLLFVNGKYKLTQSGKRFLNLFVLIRKIYTDEPFKG